MQVRINSHENVYLQKQPQQLFCKKDIPKGIRRKTPVLESLF